MDAFNRFLMRASGEERHQAQGPAESATFAVLDVLRTRDKLSAVLAGSEEECSALVDHMVGDVGRALSRFDSPRVLMVTTLPPSALFWTVFGICIVAGWVMAVVIGFVSWLLPVDSGLFPWVRPFDLAQFFPLLGIACLMGTLAGSVMGALIAFDAWSKQPARNF